MNYRENEHGNVDWLGFRPQRPDAHANPCCSGTPHDVPPEDYNDQTDEIRAKNYAKSGPHVAVVIRRGTVIQWWSRQPECDEKRQREDEHKLKHEEKSERSMDEGHIEGARGEVEGVVCE